LRATAQQAGGGTSSTPKVPGIASSKLHSEAQSIRGAATLTDHRQVGFVERVVAVSFVFGIWQCQQAAARWRTDEPWHGQSSRRYLRFAADAEVAGTKVFDRARARNSPFRSAICSLFSDSFVPVGTALLATIDSR
jgi:hypothetical protein